MIESSSEPSISASALYTGATFMKFGRAPTTKVTVGRPATLAGKVVKLQSGGDRRGAVGSIGLEQRAVGGQIMDQGASVALGEEDPDALPPQQHPDLGRFVVGL